MRYSRNSYFRCTRKGLKDYEVSLSLTTPIPNDLVMHYAKCAWKLYDAHHLACSRRLRLDPILYDALKDKIDDAIDVITNFCKTHTAKKKAK